MTGQLNEYEQAMVWEQAVADWSCVECGKPLPVPYGVTADDLADPGTCGVWCEFTRGLEGEQRKQAWMHMTLQSFMDRVGPQNFAYPSAFAQCERIDHWFQQQDVVTPEW